MVKIKAGNVEITKFIPNSYLPIISCSIEVKYSNVDVAICTTTGQFMTFCKRFPVQCCDINCTDVHHIFIFHSFEPLTKYFVLQSNYKIIVIKDESGLKVYKTFEDVINIEINDFWKCGTSQIKLSFENSEEPLITDFINETELTGIPHTCEIECVDSLHSNLKHLESRILSTEKIIQEKILARKLIISNLFSEIYDANDRENLSELLVGSVTKKVFNDQWCIVFSAENRSDITLSNIHVSINSSDNIEMYRVKWFYLYDEPENLGFNKVPARDFSYELLEIPDFKLHPKVPSYAVISFPLTKFANDNILSIYISILYTIEKKSNEHCIKLPEICLNILDLYDNSCQVISEPSKAQIYDILSVIITSDFVPYKILVFQQLYGSMKGILSLMNFRYIGLMQYYFRSTSTYSGILVRVNEQATNEWSFETYTRNQKEHIHFIRGLSFYLPINTKIMVNKFYNMSTNGNEVNDLERKLKMLAATYKNKLSAVAEDKNAVVDNASEGNTSEDNNSIPTDMD